MLFYLDNWQSADPNAPDLQERAQRRAAMRRPMNRRPGVAITPPAAANPQQPRQKRGLNENYGRELMELHTLGVDGGYTQQDVIEVARASPAGPSAGRGRVAASSSSRASTTTAGSSCWAT